MSSCWYLSLNCHKKLTLRILSWTAVCQLCILVIWNYFKYVLYLSCVLCLPAAHSLDGNCIILVCHSCCNINRSVESWKIKLFWKRRMALKNSPRCDIHIELLDCVHYMLSVFSWREPLQHSRVSCQLLVRKWFNWETLILKNFMRLLVKLMKKRRSEPDIVLIIDRQTGSRWTDEWMGGWVDGCMGAWVDEQTNRQTNRQWDIQTARRIDKWVLLMRHEDK